MGETCEKGRVPAKLFGAEIKAISSKSSCCLHSTEPPSLHFPVPSLLLQGCPRGRGQAFGGCGGAGVAENGDAKGLGCSGDMASTWVLLGKKEKRIAACVGMCWACCSLERGLWR